MKQLIFILLQIGYLSNLNSQDYVPMAVDSATWLMTNGDEFPQFSESIVLRIEGDTIINGLNYSKLYHYDVYLNEVLSSTRKLLGVIRDDVNQKKVFGGLINGIQFGFETFLSEDIQCEWGDMNSFQEHLLYDFSLQEGDTINNCMYPFPTIISSVETIERHGFQRRNYVLDHEGYAIMTEGIGTCIGIFKGEQCYITGYDYYTLENFCIGSFSNCNITTPITQHSLNLRIDIFPNPTQTFLNIEASVKLKKVSFFNLNGTLMKDYEKTTQIDMSNFLEGIYVIKIEDEEGNIFSQKVVKN